MCLPNPSVLWPQQVIVPSLRTAHECEPPAATALNVPDGATAACPVQLSPPQQAMVSSVPIAHECSLPAETALNVSGTGVNPGASDSP